MKSMRSPNKLFKSENIIPISLSNIMNEYKNVEDVNVKELVC